MFDPIYYSKKRGIGGDSIDLEKDFLNNGIELNVSPNFYFDIELAAFQLNEVDESKLRFDSVLLNWTDQFYNDKQKCPSENFNIGYYNTKYKDVKESDLSAYSHFIIHGYEEGRFPSKDIENSKGENFNINIYDLCELIPDNKVSTLFSSANLNFIKNLFSEEFYRKQLLDSGIALSVLERKNIFSHFLNYGLTNGYRPSCIFNIEHYLNQVKILPEGADATKKNAFIHWVIKGKDLEIVPTVLFDKDYYLKHNNDLKKWKKWIFIHFVQFGLKEGRAASPYFNNKYYKLSLKHKVSDILLENYMLNEEFENVAPSDECNLQNMEKTPPLKETSKLELFASYCEDKKAKLDSPLLSSLIEHAYGIEPMIKRPNPFGYRQIQIPPIKHALASLPSLITEIRNELERNQYDNIILIPHCRMAGSAKIAGYFSQAIELFSKNNLLISTDLSDFERPEWFSTEIEILKLTEYIADLAPVKKQLLLLDLLRGLNPKNIINLNSNLCWGLIKEYGNPLSKHFNIYVYLFCWDLDSQGRMGGYPIQWFYRSFQFFKGIFVDSDFLKQNFKYRFNFPNSLLEKITVLHTPEIDLGLNFSKNIGFRKDKNKKKRCFWMGRFDRQKRFDIVIEVAKLLPEIEFSVWGKQVIVDPDLDLKNLPKNIILNGVFTDFETLPFYAYDFYFYTSEWDGLPNALIEVALIGMPVVSTTSGGVTDLLNEDTAFLVDSLDDMEAFVERITEVYDSPDLASLKAERLKEHTKEICNWDRFNSTINDVLNEQNAI
jgi:glycosyltransferase involved in cell wall biosynthesis